MKLHILKILSNYYDEVYLGEKKAELRFNDRDFQVNDLIHFVKTDGSEISFDISNVYRITYVLKDVKHLALATGWAILSIERLK